MDHSQSEQNFKKGPIVAVLLAGAFVAILNQTLLATAIPHIMSDLQISANTAQWLNTVFMLVNGIMIPITAFLIGRFTTRSLYFTAMGLFAAGTIICAVSPNFQLLMVGRIVQAAGAGITLPLMQTVLFMIFPVDRRGSAMGMVGLVISFAPAIGPTLSGWLVGQYPWSTLFYIILPIVIIDIIFAYFLLKNVTKQTFPKVDVLSIILSTFGFGGLLYGFSSAGASGWGSYPVIISMVVGAVTVTSFILRQLKLEQPILEFRVFKYSIFTITTAIGIVVFMSMIGAATILPIYMQDMHGFSALKSGLMLLPGAVVMGVMSPITGRIFDKIGARSLSITGLSLMTITTFMFTFLSDSTSFAYLAGMHTVRMLGMAMVMMPVTTAGLNQLPSRLIPHGTAMNNTMRQVGGSIGTALLVTIMTNNAIEGVPAGMIHGVNISFLFATGLALIGLVLSFFIKRSDRPGREKMEKATRYKKERQPV